MKKSLLLLLFLSLAACSSDSDSDAADAYTEPLDGAVLTPHEFTLIGNARQYRYYIVKGQDTLDNLKYKWAVSDTLKGRIYNDGSFYSGIIGQNNVMVSDNDGNTLTATMNTVPAITDIPEIPFIKWGASIEEITAAITPLGWTRIGYTQSITDPVYKKGNVVIEYSTSASTGMYDVEFNEDWNYGGIIFYDSEKLLNYLRERYLVLDINDPNYYGVSRWWYVNEFGQKVYANVQGFTNTSPYHYTLRFAKGLD